MKLGLIARAGSTGLAHQARGYYDWLKPARTLVVHLGDREPYPLHPEWYPDACAWLEVDDITEHDLDLFFDGLDVVLTCETIYVDEAFTIARAAGVTTVVQGNAEFMRWIAEPDIPRPDLFIAPSTWQLDRWPDGTVYMPVPVDTTGVVARPRTKAERFLHVAGHRTNGDRNGTSIVLDAARYARGPLSIIVRSQDPIRLPRVPRWVDVDLRVGVVERWQDLYDEGDVMVLPRRWGGLSLPLQEAAAHGLALLTTDRDPERELPGHRVPTMPRRRTMNVQSGPMVLDDANPRALASAMIHMVEHPELVAAESARSIEWARSISWETLLPLYQGFLAGARSR